MKNPLYKQRTATHEFKATGKKVLVVRLRFDDSCGNGHNTFAITGELWESQGYKRTNNERGLISCGCIHDEIKKHAPKEISSLIKWHHVSDDGPIHYVENTLFFLGYKSGPGDYWYNASRDELNIEHARNAAVWPEMPDSFMCDKDARMLKQTREAAAVKIREALEARREKLMNEFFNDMARIRWAVEILKNSPSLCACDRREALQDF